MLDFVKQHLQYILGSVIVAFYAVKRFGTPEINQSSTTRLRYRRSCFSYLLAAQLLFFLLSRVVSSAGVLTALAPKASMPEDVLNLSAPLLSALLLTTFISSVPFLSDVDQWLLNRFRELGNIPDELKRRAAGLELAKLPVTIDLEAFRTFVEQTAEIPNELLDEVAAGEETQATKCLIRNLVLYRWLYTASTRRPYARFLRRRDAEWQDVQERFSAFCNQSLSMFASARVLSSVKTDQGSSRELAALRHSYAAHCKAMFNAMARFMVQAVFACEPNERAISQRLEEIGFTAAEPEQPSFPTDQVALVSIGLLSMLVVGPAMLPHLGLPTFPVIPGVPNASILALTSTTHIAAIFAAVWCKHEFAPFSTYVSRRRSVVGYCATFVLALVAAESAALTVFATTDLLTYSWVSPAVLLGFPYMHFTLYAAIIATAVALACDIEWRCPSSWHRWLDGALCGSVIMASVLPVDWMIIYLAGDSAAAPFPSGDAKAVPLEMSAYGFIVGAIPGACIPTWYRASLLKREDAMKCNPGTPPFSETFAELRRTVLGPVRPVAGDAAAGYGVSGVVASVPDRQPLAQDGIWRVTLNGEGFGRLVRSSGRKRDRAWQLLQIDDITDAQFEAYEKAMSEQPEQASTAPVAETPRAAA